MRDGRPARAAPRRPVVDDHELATRIGPAVEPVHPAEVGTGLSPEIGGLTHRSGGPGKLRDRLDLFRVTKMRGGGRIIRLGEQPRHGPLQSALVEAHISNRAVAVHDDVDRALVDPHRITERAARIDDHRALEWSAIEKRAGLVGGLRSVQRQQLDILIVAAERRACAAGPVATAGGAAAPRLDDDDLSAQVSPREWVAVEPEQVPGKGHRCVPDAALHARPIARIQPVEP